SENLQRFGAERHLKRNIRGSADLRAAAACIRCRRIKAEARISSGLERSDISRGTFAARPTCAPQPRASGAEGSRPKRNSLAVWSGATSQEEHSRLGRLARRSRVHQVQKDQGRSENLQRFGAERHLKRNIGGPAALPAAAGCIRCRRIKAEARISSGLERSDISRGTFAARPTCAPQPRASGAEGSRPKRESPAVWSEATSQEEHSRLGRLARPSRVHQGQKDQDRSEKLQRSGGKQHLKRNIRGSADLRAAAACIRCRRIKAEARISSGLERSDISRGTFAARPTCAPQPRASGAEGSRPKPEFPTGLSEATSQEEHSRLGRLARRSRVHQVQKDQGRSENLQRFGAKRHLKRNIRGSADLRAAAACIRCRRIKAEARISSGLERSDISRGTFAARPTCAPQPRASGAEGSRPKRESPAVWSEATSQEEHSRLGRLARRSRVHQVQKDQGRS